MRYGETDNTQKPKVDPAPPWLLSFGDVTALLLTFFVMLFSMSTLQSEKWEAIISKLNSSKEASKQFKPIPNANNNVATVELAPALPLGYLGEVLDEKLKEDPVLARAIIHQLEDAIVVSLPSDLLFAAGQVTLTADAKEALFRLSGVIETVGNHIEIEGHAAPENDDRGIYSSAWSLSLARAIAVSNELEKSGYVRKTAVLGVASSRFGQLDQRISEERRFELARRVDIVIRPDQGEVR
jgi:chemotaxis protein MotB